MQDMDALQTVDFHTEMALVRDKIQLSGDLRRVTDLQSHTSKQSVEQLAKIHERILKIESLSEGYTIRIEEGLKAAL